MENVLSGMERVNAYELHIKSTFFRTNMKMEQTEWPTKQDDTYSRTHTRKKWHAKSLGISILYGDC